MTKTCSKCKIKKDISLFYRDNYKANGRQSHCKICHNKITMTWRKANPDKYSKYSCSPKNNEKMKIKSMMRGRKHRHNMSDKYIRDLITVYSDLEFKDIPDEFVKAYRINLKLKRKLELTRKLKPLT